MQVWYNTETYQKHTGASTAYVPVNLNKVWQDLLCEFEDVLIAEVAWLYWFGEKKGIYPRNCWRFPSGLVVVAAAAAITAGLI